MYFGKYKINDKVIYMARLHPKMFSEGMWLIPLGGRIDYLLTRVNNNGVKIIKPSRVIKHLVGNHYNHTQVFFNDRCDVIYNSDETRVCFVSKDVITQDDINAIDLYKFKDVFHLDEG